MVDGQAGAAPPRVYPAYAYLGPLLAVLLVTTIVIPLLTAPATTMLPITLSQEYGWRPQQIAMFFTVFSSASYVISFILALVVMYLGVRHHMDWFMFLLSPGGRASRAQFWLRYWVPFFILGLILGVIGVAGAALTAAFAGMPLEEALLIGGSQLIVRLIYLDLLTIWPAFAVNVKRLHDRGKSGWFLLLLLIPIIGPIWLFIEIGFLPGKAGENRYGPDPRGGAA